jgi:hypothetical protein
MSPGISASNMYVSAKHPRKPALVRGQPVQDPPRVERVLALGRLGTHDLIVTFRVPGIPRRFPRGCALLRNTDGFAPAMVALTQLDAHRSGPDCRGQSD